MYAVGRPTMRFLFQLLHVYTSAKEVLHVHDMTFDSIKQWWITIVVGPVG